MPRALVTAQDLGPFTVFHRSKGWPYYARPRLGADEPFTAADVERVRARQRRLGVPEAFEWVEEISPGVAAAVEATGLEVSRHQLMVLDHLQPAPMPDGFSVRMLPADDPAIATTRAAINLGFQAGGTEPGPAGPRERDLAVAGADRAAAFVSECIGRGLTVAASAEGADGPVAGGSYSPRGTVAEIVGVATLPSARRLGLASAVTAALVTDARARGVEVCFLSAENDDVARIYGRLGFTTVATAATAEAE